MTLESLYLGVFINPINLIIQSNSNRPNPIQKKQPEVFGLGGGFCLYQLETFGLGGGLRISQPEQSNPTQEINN